MKYRILPFLMLSLSARADYPASVKYEAAPGFACAPGICTVGPLGRLYIANANDACVSFYPTNAHAVASTLFADTYECRRIAPDGLYLMIAPIYFCGATISPSGPTCAGTPPGVCASLNCDDANACTVDTCTAPTGCAHAARTCDDGMACTQDWCDPDGGVCINAVAVSACSCQGSAPLPTTLQTTKGLGLGTMGCPAPQKGSLGATLSLSGNGALASAWCGNGCKGLATLGGTAALDLSVCGTTVTVSASGKYAVEKAHDKTCDAATCGTGCGAGYCETDEGSGSVSVGQSRFFGYDWSEKLAGGGKVFAKCGATLAGSVSVTGGLKEVTNHGAASCATCLSSNMALTGEAGATATCSYGISSPWGSKETGCLKCATVKTSVSGTANSQSGTCGSQACNALKGSVSAALTTPTVKLGLKWWTVEATCTATVDACRESNTCGTCTCGGAACSDFQPKMSCSVCAAGSLLAACRKS